MREYKVWLKNTNHIKGIDVDVEDKVYTASNMATALARAIREMKLSEKVGSWMEILIERVK